MYDLKLVNGSILDVDTGMEKIRIIDTATFESPVSIPEGIDYVVINGEIALQQKNVVNNRLGKAIRRTDILKGR